MLDLRLLTSELYVNSGLVMEKVDAMNKAAQEGDRVKAQIYLQEYHVIRKKIVEIEKNLARALEIT